MSRLQHYFNPEEAEEQSKDNKLVDLKYIGSLPHLAGKKGEGYYIVAEDRWYFRPNGSEDFYRVKAENLNFEA